MFKFLQINYNKCILLGIEFAIKGWITFRVQWRPNIPWQNKCKPNFISSDSVNFIKKICRKYTILWDACK